MRGSGPDSDVVISSRIRLARNLADYPFITRATPADRVEIEKTFRDAIEKSGGQLKLSWVDVAKLEGLDRQFLVERQLISREHADSDDSGPSLHGDPPSERRGTAGVTIPASSCARGRSPRPRGRECADAAFRRVARRSQPALRTRRSKQHATIGT